MHLRALIVDLFCFNIFNLPFQQEVANHKLRAVQIDLEDLFNVTNHASLVFYLHFSCVSRKFSALNLSHCRIIFQYKDLDEEFFTRVTENTRRYIGVFASAIDEILPEPTEAFPDDDHEILMTQRTEDGMDNTDGSDPQQKMPPEIKRYLYA